jgi:hypothetical protein
VAVLLIRSSPSGLQRSIQRRIRVEACRGRDGRGGLEADRPASGHPPAKNAARATAAGGDIRILA